VSAFPVALGRLGRPTRGKAAKKTKRRARGATVSAEYNMLLTATLCLLALGAVMVFSASSTTKVLSDGGFSESAFYLKRTLMFGAVGLIVMHLVARRGLGVVRNLTPAILGVAFFLLCAVLVAGTTVNGASRWLGSGFLQVQPSEIAKVALILYGADLLARKPKRARSIEGFMPFLLVVAAAAGLIMLEPDMGTTMVLTFAVGATLIAAGARPRDLALIAAGIAFLALLMAVIEPYRMARLTAFLNPGADAGGAGFQAAQAKIALGSGGLFGEGIGNGVQKAFYLPEAHTDMISAVIGEELGLVGIVGVVGLFAMFGYAGFKVAQNARDVYGKLLVTGLTSLILVQATINLFAVTGLAPLTGVPLPFVSYGNSSLLTSLFAVGLILNVARGGTAKAARSATGSRAGKLRVVDGGRTPTRARSKAKGASRKAQGRGRGGGNRGSRGARHGGRRRASG
jgi:cell division protein FtsW